MSAASFAHLLFEGAGGAARCCTYPERTPTLSIDGPPLSLSFAPRRVLRVTSGELAFYQQLHAQLGAFVAECAQWVPAAGGES